MKYIYSKAFKTLSNMEHHAQSIDDALIGGLSYKLKAGASYITNRRSVSYFASGGNSYSPTGVKVMKFNLTGDQWMDPSTFRIMFQLNNIGNAGVDPNGQQPLKELEPLSWNPAVFFRRARIICGGVVVEDIDSFNRLSLMVTALKTEEEQRQIALEGFGSYDTKFTDGTNDIRASYRIEDYDRSGDVKLSRRVIFKPLFGLFSQDKLLPLRYCPIQLELELVNSLADVIVVRDPVTHTDQWNISDIQCKCDLLTLDNSLDNEYASHLLSGKSLPINFATWSHTNQSTNMDKNFSANIHRALSRLKSIFVTLTHADTMQYKEANNFFHPTAVTLSDNYNPNDEHTFQVQIGSKVMPEYPMWSGGETLYQLAKTVGHPLHIFAPWARSHRYIIGLDCEKISGAGFTRTSLKSGDQITLNFRDLGAEGRSNSVPHRMYCALYYDCVLNIQDSGIQVLD